MNLFYVKRYVNWMIVRKTELIEKRGTWHYYRDVDGGDLWRSRGARAYTSSYQALKAEARRILDEDTGEAFEDVMQLIGAARDQSYGHGMRDGRTVQQSKCGCYEFAPKPAPKPRSFLRRLCDGCPFAAC